MQLKAPKSRNMASLKDEELATTNRQNNHNNNNNNNNVNNNSTSSNASTSVNNNNNNNNNEDAATKRESLEQRKQQLEQRLSEKSWLLQQIQKQETAIIHGNYEHLTINEFFAQLAQQYKHEQQLQSKDTNALLRRKQSTGSRSDTQSFSNSHSNNNNNRHSETHSNRSSEYDNYQPAGAHGDMLVIGVAQQQSQQHPHVKSALKKRPTPTPTSQIATQQLQQQHIMLQQQLHHMDNMLQHAAYQQQQQQQHPQQQQQQRFQPNVISMYSANSSNVATLRQQHVAPQQQPIIVQCDKYYLSPTHQSYNEGGFIKSSQNIKKYVSPLASPSAISYEQSSLQHQQHQRQLDAISLAPSYMSVEMESVQQLQQQQQYRWRSQSHIAALTPPHPHQNQSMTAAMAAEAKSHSSDMLAAPILRYNSNSKAKLHDEISLCSTTIEKKVKPKQWLESSLDGPAVVRQIESTAHSPVSSNSSSIAAAAAPKPRTKLSSQSMSVSGRHYSMSAQRGNHNYAPAGYVVPVSSKALQHAAADERFAKLSQSTSYLNETVGISASYPLEPLDIPAFRNLPPKPNHNQQPTPPPRPPPVSNNNNNNSYNSPNVNNNMSNNNVLQSALISPPLTVATATVAASLSPEIRIESPKNMTIVQQATFQPYKEVTKPFEMSDFYKYSTKFKQKEGRPE